MKTQNLRKTLTEDEYKWLKSHPECQCELTPQLLAYRAKEVYDLSHCCCEKPKSFFDNFIILFSDGLIEIWGASSIQALSDFVKNHVE